VASYQPPWTSTVPLPVPGGSGSLRSALSNRPAFYRADFSGWQTPGRYVLQTTSSDGDVRSGPFIIGADLLERYTLSDVIAYFKSQRVTGLFDKEPEKSAR
jgi:hypothetical protein